jgi:hypothetical protein
MRKKEQSFGVKEKMFGCDDDGGIEKLELGAQ